MKFSKIAAAALLAAASVPSMAAVGLSTPSTAEMFLVVVSPTATYSFDTGLMFSAFEANANTAGYNISFNIGANADWANYLTTGSNLANSQWFFAAAFTDGAFGPNTGVATTKNASANFLSKFDGDQGSYIAGAQNLSLAVGDTNQIGSHRGAVSVNGSAVALKGNPGYMGNEIIFGTSNYNLGNNIGVTSKVYRETMSSDEPSETGTSVAYKGTASFDGTTLSYAVAAVPEPETYALMLAGLVAVAGIARRRRAA